MDIYVWLKALHIAAAATWIGGLLACGLAIRGATAGRSFVPAVRRWDRAVTAPAMLLAWTLGIVMAVKAGWFVAPWLMVKLVVVVALSALHGLLSGTLRRLENDPGRPVPAALGHAAPVAILCLLVVVVLAVTKPL